MSEELQPSLAYVSLKGRCPRCGKGALYKSFMTVAENCSVCHLSFREHEQGDGPAFFCICIIGALTGILAAIVEVIYQPPYWLHAAIWIPFIIISSLFGIRIMKAALIALQYRFKRDDFTGD